MNSSIHISLVLQGSSAGRWTDLLLRGVRGQVVRCGGGRRRDGNRMRHRFFADCRYLERAEERALKSRDHGWNTKTRVSKKNGRLCSQLCNNLRLRRQRMYKPTNSATWPHPISQIVNYLATAPPRFCSFISLYRIITRSRSSSIILSCAPVNGILSFFPPIPPLFRGNLVSVGGAITTSPTRFRLSNRANSTARGASGFFGFSFSFSFSFCALSLSSLFSPSVSVFSAIEALTIFLPSFDDDFTALRTVLRYVFSTRLHSIASQNITPPFYSIVLTD